MNIIILLMCELLKQYNKDINLKYYKSLKKILNKQHNNKYNSYFDNIFSEDLTESDNLVNNLVNKENTSESITQSISISDIKINDDNNEDFYYKKQWNKLNIIHKKIKIKEYINNLTLVKQKKKILIDKLLILLKEKKLNKKNEVDYDINNGKIISISILKCKNDEYYI
jgi:hypothetical protein